jgi:hypothetical protein
MYFVFIDLQLITFTWSESFILNASHIAFTVDEIAWGDILNK